MNRLPLRPRNPESGGAPGLWTPGAWSLAQINHTLAAPAIHAFVLIAGAPPALTFVGIFVWAAFKEYVLDTGTLQPLVDWLMAHGVPGWACRWLALERDSWNGSTQDFLAYVIGDGALFLSTFSVALGASIFAVALISYAVMEAMQQHKALSVFPYD